ncbi:glutathionylspermidine synthase family protein [Pseudobacteroides cellulosolvens]|uniref:Glutathionylspermidine synthase n=1 Tax=Pseudobacteroides cellulosolvens ATCC 35603 = DSM 2933 TaxID=398512 RepID=A0A0L6JL23_9FIRM|nr:glutathionylspermidine synthase family protein [Pseudobacteroides cellulosolvens]KNY26087.1 glutathionylspermidine synthase [Pseudobacteroides cellulosolvens ATCC 35603 = DSM 2933]
MSRQTRFNQRKHTENILFDYYMVSSSREDLIHSKFPVYLEKSVYEDMVYSAEVLDKLVRRIIERTVDHKDDMFFHYGEFPLHQLVKSLKLPLPPFFWARFDAFIREDGGIFFSEFNYDKPCAQREIIIAGECSLEENPNLHFIEDFQKAFKNLWDQFGNGAKNPNVAILVDPGHYEEAHLGFLYRDLLKPLGFETIIAGGKNLEVEGDCLYSFGNKIDIILRQFPTEHLYECNDAERILDLYQKGKILLLNDPRVVFGQTKSLFAYLWEMVERRDPFLSDEEVSVIVRTIPKSTLYDPSHMDEVIKNKNDYVIKAAYGRYSHEVYIGCMHNDNEWLETIKTVNSSTRLHILQEFCPVQKQNTMYYNGRFYDETQAMGNYGIYLTNGSFSGVCVRWSRDYLSLDETVWSSPVGIGVSPFSIVKLPSEGRKDIWNNINEKTAFEYGYTGGYTGACESFSLDALVIRQQYFNELEEASEGIWAVIEKTIQLVRENHSIFCPVLGIEDSLQDLITQNVTDHTAFIARLDWGMDPMGNWHMLEINSETPAGLMESIALNNVIKNELKIELRDPNRKLIKLIREVFESIVSDYSRFRPVRNIGFVTDSFSEDWYNTRLLSELLADTPYNIIIGEISGLSARDKRLYLYDEPLDAIYRYYPLDWLANDPYFDGVTLALMENTPSINSPVSFICQSKAFLALVWELNEQGFYEERDSKLIEKYIPKTALTAKKMKGIENYIIKPFFGREGQDITFSFSMENGKTVNSIFQEWVDLKTVQLNLHTTVYSAQNSVCPVIGTYMLSGKFGGIYTRGGSRVTDHNAVYIPTYID